MAQRRMDKDLLQIRRCAYLRAEFGLTEQAIADVLGGEVYKHNVNRWLRDARQQKLLVERTVLKFVPRGLTGEEMKAVTEIRTWHELGERLRGLKTTTGVPIRSVRIFPSGEGSIDVRLKRFSIPAAACVAAAIARSETFAVAWGFTLSNVIDALEGMDIELPGKNVEFTPVCGDELEQRSHRTSSSVLAERLDELVNHRQKNRPDDYAPTLSLQGVPAFTPHWFADDVKFREYLHDFPDFHAIFGLTERDRRLGTQSLTSGNPIVDRVDTLLTSIGSRNKPVGRFYERLKKHGRIEAEELSRIVAGDVGGVLIPSPDCDADGLQRVAHLNEIWTGLQPDHLTNIARGANAHGRPGVVIVSVGDQDGARATTLAAIVRAGLANELIIDRQLADALSNALKAV
jgi:DNA-binding transcriptional regulator LsrR (DeoR family)